MGKFGEFFKKIGILEEDDEDLDDDMDEMEDDFEEEKPRRSFLNKKKEYEEEEEEEPAPAPVRQVVKPTKPASKVVPMRTGGKGLEVCVIKPTSIEDASEITDTLLSGKAVVLNFEGVHVEIAQRIIDFTSGSSYSMDGNLQKITNYIFIATPPNVDVSGDLQELMSAGAGVNVGNVKPQSTLF